MRKPAARPAKRDDRSDRRVPVLWGVGLGLLLLLGLFCWLVLEPCLEVRASCARLCSDNAPSTVAEVERLGGPKAAARKAILYSRLPDRFASYKGAAATIMGHCGSEAVPRLIELLHHAESAVRLQAASALGSTCDQRAVEPLIHALGDSDPFVPFHAASALGDVGDDRAIPALEALARSNSNPLAAFASVEAIAKIRARAGKSQAGAVTPAPPRR